MAKRRPPVTATFSEPWFVRRDASKTPYAFFISHVAEDAAEVARLKAEVDAYSGRGGRTPADCFLDVHNWPAARVIAEVIREKLLESIHSVFWVTPAFLKSLRGWIWMELAYAELIELSGHVGTMDRRPYIVPVFRGVTVQDVERTPLLAYWQRNLGRPDSDIKEIAKGLVDFHELELTKREPA